MQARNPSVFFVTAVAALTTDAAQKKCGQAAFKLSGPPHVPSQTSILNLRFKAVTFRIS